MTAFELQVRWLSRTLDLPEDTATFAAVTLRLGDQILTRSFDPRLSVRRDHANIPTYALALGIAKNWWPLLYEVERDVPRRREAFEATHCLDGFLPGYAFPPLGLWSGGEEAVAVGLFQSDGLGLSSLEFDTPQLPTMAARADVESQLVSLVEMTLARGGLKAAARQALEAAWHRVLASMDAEPERNYCESAGRLGIDPYDPEAEDISAWAEGFSVRLFADICEAVTLDDLPGTIDVVRAFQTDLDRAQAIDLSGFPSPPRLGLSARAAGVGYEAARALRLALGLGDDPRSAVTALVGKAVGKEQTPSARVPVEGIAMRSGDKVRSIVTGRWPGQQQFRLCRATYLAWTAEEEVDFAVTSARTRAQQTSRAFAAELLAPVDYLRQRMPPNGFTEDDIDDLALELGCSNWIVGHQIQNHPIELRGVGPA